MEPCYEAKVFSIFKLFDVNGDRVLSREEMAVYAVSVNPVAKISDEEINAYLNEIFYTYGEIVDGKEGLTYAGLLFSYYDGFGDANRDFDTFAYDLKLIDLDPIENDISRDAEIEQATKREQATEKHAKCSIECQGEIIEGMLESGDAVDKVTAEPVENSINIVATYDFEVQVNGVDVGICLRECNFQIGTGDSSIMEPKPFSDAVHIHRKICCLNDAYKVFDNMPEKKTFAWNSSNGQGSSLEFLWDPGRFKPPKVGASTVVRLRQVDEDNGDSSLGYCTDCSIQLNGIKDKANQVDVQMKAFHEAEPNFSKQSVVIFGESFLNASLFLSKSLVHSNLMANSVKKLVSYVILDVDETILDTDGIGNDVIRVYLLKYGEQLDPRATQKIVGKTILEAAAIIVEEYGLPLSAEEAISKITPMFSEQWCNAKALPGANRLIKHLRVHIIPIALASNSSRASIETKISYHPSWKESFSVIVTADEVKAGKPSPEIFLEAARSLKTDPACCLVIEDSLPGVTAGKAAGMKVVAVPSLPKQSHLYTSANEVINSLLDLRPEKWGLPPFEDWINGTLPLEPWYIGGPVIEGFGRGSKVLGIPTGEDSVCDILVRLSIRFFRGVSVNIPYMKLVEVSSVCQSDGPMDCCHAVAALFFTSAISDHNSIAKPEVVLQILCLIPKISNQPHLFRTIYLADSALVFFSCPVEIQLIPLLMGRGLNSQDEDAIHLTENEATINCDTFIPAVSVSVFYPRTGIGTLSRFGYKVLEASEVELFEDDEILVAEFAESLPFGLGVYTWRLREP